MREDTLTLLLALVPYLRERGAQGASVAEIASHFGVGESVVRKCVLTIATSGAPGESGVSLDNDLFDIDWDAFEVEDTVIVTRFVGLEQTPNLTPRERTAILGGLGYLAGLPGDSTVVAGLIEKLGGTEVDAAPAFVVGQPNEATATRLNRAIQERERMRIRYRSPNSGERDRTVEPLVLVSNDADLYLRAWCLDAEGVRLFRLDRILHLEGTSEHFEEHDGSLAMQTESLFMPSDADYTVAVEFDEPVAKYVRDYLDAGQELPACVDGVGVVNVRVANLYRIVRFAAEHPGRVRLREPENARDAAVAWAQSGLETLAKTTGEVTDAPTAS